MSKDFCWAQSQQGSQHKHMKRDLHSILEKEMSIVAILF